MIRLATLYHDDTREPVAVQEMMHTQYGAFYEGISHAGLSLDRGVWACGPEAEACKALLLRERAHWLAEKEAGDKQP